MADPEQIYQEVLQEEQRRGSAGPVAEGRAKAARVRTEHGSPHPKEPKWWPGAQPHLDGEEGAAPAEEAPAAEVPAAEAPPAEAAEPGVTEPAPAAEPPAPVEQPAAATAPAPQPATAAPATAEAPPALAAAQPVAQAPAAMAAPVEAPEAQRPSGVTHGTASGNRLRPEDAVSTEAQFDGERAMHERRKLIDDLIATGVPAVTARETGRPRAPYLAVLYLLIPLLVVAFLVSRDGSPSSEPAGDAAVEEPGAGGGDGGSSGGADADATLVAQNVQFDTDSIALPAQTEAVVFLDNQDGVEHNFSLYPDEQAADAQGDAIFQGDVVGGGDGTEYAFESPSRGEYVFQCDIHPSMRGTATVE
ncbi:MAG: plastocyanin/azurin family copper-binding protein [Actinomycetota bacterium]